MRAVPLKLKRSRGPQQLAARACYVARREMTAGRFDEAGRVLRWVEAALLKQVTRPGIAGMRTREGLKQVREALDDLRRSTPPKTELRGQEHRWASQLSEAEQLLALGQHRRAQQVVETVGKL